MKQTVQIEIAGTRYRLSSDADETHLQKLALEVNRRIDALGPKAARAGTPAQLLAVVALGLVDDLENSYDKCRELQSRTRDVVTSAIQRIDTRLQADARASSSSPPTPGD